jgi:hypothetical protein
MLPTSAVDHYKQQQAIGVQAVRQVSRAWGGMSGDFDASWQSVAPLAVQTTIAAQAAAAATGIEYVSDVLDETGIDAPAEASVTPRGFVGIAADGRPVATLLDGATIRAKQAVASGANTVLALKEAGDWLQGSVLDSVRFANRQAVAASIAVRPAVQGWVRMLNPPSCKFCVTLAGKWFRWNEGFPSHPHCDCRHIPAQESTAGDTTVDPYAYFGSLDEKAQDRLFGKNDAQAIRDGADIYRVVNIRSRGLSTGRQGRKFGTPSKMTVDEIFAEAKTRSEAIALLAREGYVTGPQVAGGNILGNKSTNAAAIARGRGRGTYLVGTERVTTRRAAEYDALISGQRDPLNRSTMTAGERRIFDDFYSAEQAILGRRARTIGANSADRGIVFSGISEEEADVLRMTFIRRIDRVRRNGTAQEKRLAERLWARYSALV